MNTGLFNARAATSQGIIAPILALCGPSATVARDEGRLEIALREIGKIVEASGVGEGA